MALGVMNTAMSSACARLADADQVLHSILYFYILFHSIMCLLFYFILSCPICTYPTPLNLSFLFSTRYLFLFFQSFTLNLFQVGGLFGVMEAVESSAGLVGPALGGILFRVGPNVPLISVVAIYSLVFIAIFMYYRDTIVKRPKKSSVSVDYNIDTLIPSKEVKVTVDRNSKKVQ